MAGGHFFYTGPVTPLHSPSSFALCCPLAICQFGSSKHLPLSQRHLSRTFVTKFSLCQTLKNKKNTTSLVAGSASTKLTILFPASILYSVIIPPAQDKPYVIGLANLATPYSKYQQRTILADLPSLTAMPLIPYGPVDSRPS
jgi:hypothetical protein